MIDKALRKLGIKDDTGIDDPSLVGFIVIWSIFGYGIYTVIVELIKRFT
tara:strand:- start:77 stop:223 length:147 start_codon:yes stop_codon:yes gene_type:complete